MSKVFAALSASILVSTANADSQQAASQLDEVMVLGSRIPRTSTQGPTPVVIVNDAAIRANGFTSVADVLGALSQNGGEVQSQQSFSSGDFTPGAQAVDLRGLGPNHTLVLVNGRRIADFPLPYKGKSNFTDISNIPLSMIDKIEVLSGSASAIYGSDAISGVVNFQLKKAVDGTTFDVRLSNTELGGGASQRFSLTTGWNKNNVNLAMGMEFLNQEPLWAWNRNIQDSTADAPTADSQSPRRTFLRFDPDGNYLDPGASICNSLANLNNHSTIYATRPEYGPLDANDNNTDGHYCGSAKAISYGTMVNGRRGLNVSASLTADITDHSQFFTDILYGYSKVRLFTDVLDWQFEDANGSEDGYFINSQIDDYDSWYRQFTPEEMGGFSQNMITNVQTTLSITAGLKGEIGAHTDNKGWSYETYFSHSEYRSTTSWPRVIRQKANDLFLGPQLSTLSDTGYPVFNADPSRLYTPLTRAEYDSITARTTYHPVTSNDSLSLVVRTPSLFTLPAGDLGFAAVVEAGSQSYRMNVDPNALGYYYYAWRDADGRGSRDHGGAGAESRIPLLKSLTADAAARYDTYRFGGNGTSRGTYNFGLEWRPVNSLLIRGAYGTAFRAPDLSYVFAGPGNTHPSGTDYYQCRNREPDTNFSDCSFADTGLVESHTGSRTLKSETSQSYNYGVVWQPSQNFFASIDYFKIDLDNEINDIDIDKLLRTEADCRLGYTTAGSSVDINSPTCVDALSRVSRYPDDFPITELAGVANGVRINPINVSEEHTSGMDISIRSIIPTRIGDVHLDGGYTRVFSHKLRQYPGDPEVDEFKPDSGYDVPRSKASASIGLETAKWIATLHAKRLDRLPNYDEVDFIPATYLFNASGQWKLSDHARVSLTVHNLFNKMPPKDPTYTSYPYYDISWFDSEGRSYYLQMTYKFGGSGL